MMVLMLILEMPMALRRCIGLLQKVLFLFSNQSFYFFGLIWSLFSGYVEITKILIEYGASVNARRRDKYTPLHLAAWNGVQIDFQLKQLQLHIENQD